MGGQPRASMEHVAWVIKLGLAQVKLSSPHPPRTRHNALGGG